MWVCLPESGSKTLASCSLEAIYLLYLECPSNAQDLVPLGSKKNENRIYEVCWFGLLFMFDSLKMFVVSCARFSSIGSIVFSESVGQLSSLGCLFSGTTSRRNHRAASWSTFCRHRGKRSGSNLLALQDVLLGCCQCWLEAGSLPRYHANNGIKHDNVTKKRWPDHSFLALRRHVAQSHWLVWINCVNCVNYVNLKCWRAGTWIKFGSNVWLGLLWM